VKGPSSTDAISPLKHERLTRKYQNTNKERGLDNNWAITTTVHGWWKVQWQEHWQKNRKLEMSRSA